MCHAKGPKKLVIRLAIVAVSVVAASGAAFGDYASPVAVALGSDGAALFVAENTANQVARVDLKGKSVAAAFALPDAPNALALSPDGSTLYVAVGGPEGKVLALDPASGEVRASIGVGHTPTAVAVSPDGLRLYVCNRFNNSVSVIDPANGTESARIPVLREPVGAAVTPDGVRLVVINHLPAATSDGDYVSAAVSIVDTAANSVSATVSLPNGSTGLRGVCLSPDGAFAYVSHILARYLMPTTQLERGWMNTNALSVIDVAAGTLVNTVLLDEVDLGAANPWGVAVSGDGRWVCVAHAGTHELSVIDRAALHEKLTRVAAGEAVSEVSKTAADVPNDLAFLVDLRRRLALPGKGPRSVVMAGAMACVGEYFTDTVALIDVSPETRPKAETIALGAATEMTVERRGELFFNDAALCFQHWQSCASCHPDSRVDGLNWDLLNDGIGNPKNTRSMLFSHVTPPAMSLAVRDSAEVAVRAGIRFIQFAVRPEEDAVAIDEYLKGLKPVPSPELVAGNLNESAARGKELFQSVGCSSCHSGDYFTDLATYDVGTGKDREAGKPLDTPTLREAWRTAPYLYDGRAYTIEEVLTKYNTDNKHGKTSGLTEQEVADLAAYVRSL